MRSGPALKINETSPQVTSFEPDSIVVVSRVAAFLPILVERIQERPKHLKRDEQSYNIVTVLFDRVTGKTEGGHQITRE